MSKPRIAYITKMFPRLSETFILNEILELEKVGAQITIFSAKKPNEGKFHPQLINLAADVFYLEGMEPKKWINWLGDVWENVAADKTRLWNLVEQAIISRDIDRLENMLYSAWVGAQIKELGIKHIHAHFASLPSTIAYYASSITGIPFSFTAHAKDIYVYQNDEYQLVDKLQAAKFVVTVTEHNRDYLQTRTEADIRDRIKVIYNGIDLDRLNFESGSGREPDLILGIGRLVPKKGFDLLLHACKVLKDNGVPFRCQIAGDGSDAVLLKQLTLELGLTDCVTFLGPKRQDEIIELMRQGTLICLPCRIAEDGNRDALPTVILEALAIGLPVISTTISGIPEIIDNNEDGILVEPENPRILAEKMTGLLNSSDDRRRLAAAGRKKAEARFDITKNIQQLFELLDHEKP